MRLERLKNCYAINNLMARIHQLEVFDYSLTYIRDVTLQYVRGISED